MDTDRQVEWQFGWQVEWQVEWQVGWRVEWQFGRKVEDLVDIGRRYLSWVDFEVE